MKLSVSWVPVFIAIFLLSGCARNGPHGGHSENWYSEHPAQAKQELAWCHNQSVDKQLKSKSCVRAVNGLASATIHDLFGALSDHEKIG